MNEITKCEFTGGVCDKGKIYKDGSIGCGYYNTERDQCIWFDDLPQGMPPRDFYNSLLIEIGG